MSIGKFFPYAATVGIVAAIWMIVSSKMGLVPWVPFLSWALFFGAGAGKFKRVPREIIGLTGGVAAAVILLYLLPFANNIVGATWGLPVLVFLAATIIVLLELTNWLDLAPAYFYSFAGFFAYLFGGFAGTTTMSPQIIFTFWILLLIGTGLGILTGFLKGVVLGALGVPAEQRKTILDKE
ncbi:MAG: DUF1097 domain-containing protein [Candidatus Spechtbacteria bacterium]|nr:DUF1097 domain-containing protein [Candidatus Spechtbacteria bacterium]